jgi:hypothetical protein
MKPHFAQITGKSAKIPVNFPVSRETEPKNRRTETARAIPASRPRGDSLHRQNGALKPGNSGVFREMYRETAIAETRWRCRESRANLSLPISLLNREKIGNFFKNSPIGLQVCR